MSKIDQQFIEFIVRSLVLHPEDVKVERAIDEKGVLLNLTVNPEDLGRIIGKRGVTAQSLRTLLRALGTKNDARYNLKIESNENNNQIQDDNIMTSGYEEYETVNNSTDMPVDNASDYSKKTREELAEFDDLDI